MKAVCIYSFSIQIQSYNTSVSVIRLYKIFMKCIFKLNICKRLLSVDRKFVDCYWLGEGKSYPVLSHLG